MIDERLLQRAERVIARSTTLQNVASTRPLQSRLCVGYTLALEIMEALEAKGVVSAPDKFGKRYRLIERILTPVFEKYALEKYYGCDGDERQAGTPMNRSTWVFGIEHGTFKSVHDDDLDPTDDVTYSIGTQKSFPYNVNLFKLLAVMEGHSARDWEGFAQERQPFVVGVDGYFKGNIYPIACNNVHEWNDKQIGQTRFVHKTQYVRWRAEKRLPTIRRWVNEHQPKLIIAMGASYRADFGCAMFGEVVKFQRQNFFENKYLYTFEKEGIPLIVLPHFSGASGLNSFASIEAAGQFIRSNYGELQSVLPHAVVAR